MAQTIDLADAGAGPTFLLPISLAAQCSGGIDFEFGRPSRLQFATVHRAPVPHGRSMPITAFANRALTPHATAMDTRMQERSSLAHRPIVEGRFARTQFLSRTDERRGDASVRGLPRADWAAAPGSLRSSVVAVVSDDFFERVRPTLGRAPHNAVWAKRTGPAFLDFHGVIDAQYQRRFDQALAAGDAPVLVACTGKGGGAVLAAVFERRAFGPWMARHGLTRAAFEAADVIARRGGVGLHSMAVSGAAGDPRFAAVWHSRSRSLLVHPRALTAAVSCQTTFDAETSLPFFRPRAIAVADDRSITAAFSNDRVGRWAAHHGLTSSQYQQVFDQNVASGLMAVCVSALQRCRRRQGQRWDHGPRNAAGTRHRGRHRVACASARIGDAQDMWDNGVIAHVNEAAKSRGLAPGQGLQQALTTLVGGQ